MQEASGPGEIGQGEEEKLCSALKTETEGMLGE